MAEARSAAYGCAADLQALLLARLAGVAALVTDLAIIVAGARLFTTAWLWDIDVRVDRATISHTESPAFNNERYEVS